MRSRSILALSLLLLVGAALPVATFAEFATFESPPVHPLERSPDGTRLFAVNTPDHRLSVFDLTQGPDPVLIQEIPVGLEPVTVRARTNGEVWVVNHLSDSISIIDLATGVVVRTILTGDEPTDVVFAGSPSRAFIVVSQEDRVLVVDAVSPGAPLASIPLALSDPRSLAVSPDSLSVYVNALDSGNRTTAVREDVVAAGLGLPAPTPPMDPGLPAAPDVSLIVRHDGAAWIDELGRSWNAVVPYLLPDEDVLRIDVATLTVTGAYTGVGTSLFNLAVNPVTGRIYAGNQEALNEVRFEPNLQGRFARTRITLIDPAGPTVTPVHLNPHIDYNVPAGTAGERALSLALPLDLAVSGDGLTVYVAGFGSGRVGVLDAAGSITRRISVGEGPAGLALDETANRLFVLNHIANTISTVDLATDLSTEVPVGFDVVPDNLRQGRGLFYDAQNSSAHGDLACASCHTFGGMDNLAWDLGDPTGVFVPPPPFGQPGSSGFHPMKGPMTTQSLRGLSGTEPLHWRGDRAALADFNGAFASLQGRAAPLGAGDMDLFSDFVLAMRYPPNPFRNLDNSLPNPGSGPNPTLGQQLFLTGNLVGALECVDCHALPSGENGLIIPAAALQESQDMVVPQLRNLYEKTRFDSQAPTTVRGFGFTHHGAIDDLFEFLNFPGFNFASNADQEHVESFLLHFDTGTPAATGAQWTMDGTNEPAGLPRVNTLVAAADAGQLGLFAKGADLSAQVRGWTYQGSGVWISDRAGEGTTTLTALLALAGPGTEITFTAGLPGCETRLGVDRDEDTHLDRDELDAGSDPADPDSVPGTIGIADRFADHGRPALAPAFPNPVRSGRTQLAFTLDREGSAKLQIFDVQGRRVRTLVDDPFLVSGEHRADWDLRDDGGRAVRSGMYFVRLVSASGVSAQRVMVLD